jgi:hypothetical protein
MTITVFFDVQATASQYDQIIRDLKAAGLEHPEGRLYHVAQPENGRWNVVDVWESAALFEKFAGSLMPILAKNSVTSLPPKVLPTHNIVKGS